tara:strand:- start:858 stop:1082 length:225 start_codon:yes stop_codon:yes gene_type:complete
MSSGDSPKFGTQLVPVVQAPTEYKRLVGINSAFKEWQYKLKRGEKLPRGKYFNGKKAGKPLIIMDEAWSFFSKS